MESEMGQTEQSNTVILSDQTTVQKEHQYVQYIHVQKSYFTRRYEKKSYIFDKLQYYRDNTGNSV